jgi:hypothetical protein
MKIEVKENHKIFSPTENLITKKLKKN